MNKYLEKLAFSRLSETSFKNLSDEEKKKVHEYVTSGADGHRNGVVIRNAIGGAAIGLGTGGLISKTRKSFLIGSGIGALAGARLGHKVADKVRDYKIDKALGHANLTSVLRQKL